MTLKCIAVVAEQSATTEIRSRIINNPNLNLIACFDCLNKALKYLEHTIEIDVIFIDIKLLSQSISTLNKLIDANDKLLIFSISQVSATDSYEFTINSLKMESFDFTNFSEQIGKTTDRFSISAESKTSPDTLFIKSKEDNNKLYKIYINDIIAVESLLNYIKIYTVNGKFITHLNLKEAKEVLKQHFCFIQIHRSFIISKNHIITVENGYLTMSDGSKFSIGNNFKEQFNSFIYEHSFKPTTKIDAAKLS